MLRLGRGGGLLSGAWLTWMFKEYSGTMAAQTSPSYKVVQRGAPFTKDFRLFYRDGAGKLVSPWHDIPLEASAAEPKTFHMVVEIPRWSNAKMEIATADPLHPIKQDLKKDKLRFVHNVFPHKGYIWNYGALPQTWEDPGHVDAGTGAKGDNDPIDVCEIGSRVAQRGEVIVVKPLGVLAMIDEGETDWKVIAIDVRDPLAQELNDIADVHRLMPGLTAATLEWFRYYKVPAGKPENEFAFDSEFKDAAFARRVIGETHSAWRGLMSGAASSSLSRAATSLPEGQGEALDGAAAEALAKAFPDPAPPAPVPDDVHAVHFIRH